MTMTQPSKVKPAKILERGFLRDCTLKMIGRRLNSHLKPWERPGDDPTQFALRVVIGGIELHRGSDYLVSCEGKAYAIKVERAQDLDNHCLVVSEWQDVALPPAKPPAVQDLGYW